jgi:hypothetical protein
MEDVKTIETVVLRDNKFKSTKGIQKMSNLKSLEILRNELIDVEGIEMLHNLERLVIDEIVNLPDLTQLEKLSYLQLSDYPFSALDGTELPESLVTITVTAFDSDMKFLKQSNYTEMVESLTFSDGTATKLKDLKNFENLKSLTINNCNFKDLEAISALKNLESLTLIDIRKITKIPDLSGITTLKNITIRHTYNESEIADIKEGLGDMVKPLKPIDLAAIQQATSLDSLNLYGHQFENLSAVEALKVANPSCKVIHERLDKINMN